MTSLDRSAEQRLRDAVAGQMSRTRAELEELTRIPSVSLGSFDAEQVERSAAAVRELLGAAGLDAQVVRLTGADGRPRGHPAVIARRAGRPGAPTVLLYAHHDVQPPGDDADWQTPPFEPVERGGRLYARGVADDKAGVMAHITALRALGEVYGDEPGVGIAVFVEGEEEVGSASLAELLRIHRDQLDCDAIVLADSANWAVGTPSLTTSLRGNVRLVVTVTALEHGVHSGLYGGPTPDAITAMCRLMAALHDDTGAVAVPGLLSDPDPADPGYDEAGYRRDAGMRPDAPLLGTGSLAARLWSRPSVTVIGIDAPSVDAAANLLAPRCRAKVSVRVAPTQDWESAYRALRDHLFAYAPWGVQVEVELEDHGNGFVATTTGRYADAVREAFTAAWGTAPLDIGLGASIPFISEFAARFPDAAILVTGVEDPDTRAHGADESLHLGEFERVCLAEALLLARLGADV